MTKKNASAPRNFPHALRASHSALILSVEAIGGAIISLLSFLLFVEIAHNVLAKKDVFLDTTLSHVVYAFRTPELTAVMRFISFLGGEIIVIAAILLVFYLTAKKHVREATLFSFTIGMGYILNTGIKALLRIPRPDIDPVYIEKFYSFPSGHAMNSFIFFAMISYLIYHFTKNTLLTLFFSVCSVVVTVLIGFSRIYLGVHFPSDVIAGFIAGFWWFITVIIIHNTFNFYSSTKSRDKR